MDDDNSKSLNKAEFNKALIDYKLGFTAGECGTLFEYFDVDSSGSISYDEFIRAVRGPMNMARKKIVAQAFKSSTQTVTAGSTSTMSEASTRPTSTQT